MAKKETLVKVKLPRIPGEDYVMIFVGDKNWRIKRGHEVEIPLCAYDVLLNAELAEDAAASYQTGLHRVEE